MSPPPTPPLDLHILLVEDDDIDVRAMRRQLQRSGLEFALVVAHDGEAALAQLELLAPETTVLIVDLNIPAMDGVQFIRHARRVPGWTAVPTCVLTTSGGVADRARVQPLQVCAYVTKSSPRAYPWLMSKLRAYADQVA